MRILFLGDVMGRSGRDAIALHLPTLKEKLKPDVIIVNVDNAAHGRGVTKLICQDIWDMGVDCLTGGDHIWDQREIIPLLETSPNIIRAINYPSTAAGRGVWHKKLPDGREILVVHLMGTTFMNPLENPFDAVHRGLDGHLLGNGKSIFVDFHAEATSEKMAMAQYLDGRVSAVVGTHTHLPTADAQIFSGGTGFQGDAGMCGDYDSIIGVKKEQPIHNFVKKVPKEKMGPAEGNATVCGTFIVSDDKTGKATFIDSVVIGPRLKNNIPSV